jgi:hypothetical protein
MVCNGSIVSRFSITQHASPPSVEEREVAEMGSDGFASAAFPEIQRAFQRGPAPTAWCQGAGIDQNQDGRTRSSEQLQTGVRLAGCSTHRMYPVTCGSAIDRAYGLPLQVSLGILGKGAQILLSSDWVMEWHIARKLDQQKYSCTERPLSGTIPNALKIDHKPETKAATEQAIGTAGSFTLFEGPSGMGKSYLIGQLLVLSAAIPHRLMKAEIVLVCMCLLGGAIECGSAELAFRERLDRFASDARVRFVVL